MPEMIFVQSSGKLPEILSVNPCGVCGGQSGFATVFFSEHFGLPPVSIIPPLLHAVQSCD